MKALSGCFLILTILSCGWISTGLFLTSQAPALVNQVAKDSKSTAPKDAQQAATAITTLLTGGVSLSFFLCTGIPAGLFCGMLAIVFYSLHTSERRHQEMLNAQMVRNDTLGNMATVQLAQAQMQYGDMQNKRALPDPNQSKYQDHYKDVNEQNPQRKPRPIYKGEKR